MDTTQLGLINALTVHQTRTDMHILHVMPSLSKAYGGPTQSLIGYARAAASQGIAVSVAAPRLGPSDRQWLAHRTPGVAQHFFRSAGQGAMVVSPGLIGWLGRHGHRFDAVHVHGLFNSISSLALRISLAKKFPVVVRPFGTLSKYTYHYRRTGLKKAYFKWLDGPNLQRVRGVHFTTPAERDESAWHGIDFGDRSHVVPPPWRAPSVPRQSPLAEPLTVLLMARLHPVKNVESLLDAWPSVQRIFPEARLIIAGDGKPEYVKHLKAKAAGLGNHLNIVFPGFVDGDTKARLLSTATLFVLPSFQENFGVAVMEAIGAGLPVVISKHVQLAAYVAEQKVGHIVDPTPDALAFSIVEILMSETYQTYCRQHGPAAVRHHFSYEAIGRQLTEMYVSVIRQAPANHVH